MASTLENRAMVAFLCLIFAWLELSHGAVYKVGDSAGWTTIGNVDYKQWAVTKTFQVGDIIGHYKCTSEVFEYNPQFHNVMQVTHAEYRACNVSSPISTHTTGNDTITIHTHGHHFFVCGVAGHCQAGQKVDINVITAPPLALSPSGVPSAVPTVTVPAPSGSGTVPTCAQNLLFGKLGWLFLILQVIYVY